MKQNKSIKESSDNEKLIYLLILFIFFNVFYTPIFRANFTFCNDINPINLSVYNNFITNNAIYLKIIIFFYILYNRDYIFDSFKDLFIIHLFCAYLFFQSLVTINTGTQIINLLNSLLFIYFIFISTNKNYLFLFIKYTSFFLLFIIILSTFFSFFYELKFLITKCYMGGFFGLEKTINISGLTTHKNSLGAYIFVSNFLLIYYHEYFKLNPTIKAFILLISILLLFYIDSITSLLLTIIITISFFTKKNKAFFTLTLIALITFLFFNFENFLNYFGRNPSLSGRLYMWESILSELQSISIFGMGIASYNFPIDSSYIIIFLECGILFAFIYFIWIAVQFFKSFVMSRKIDNSIIFLAILLYSITEGIGVFYSTNIVILVMFTTYFKKLNEKEIS